MIQLSVRWKELQPEASVGLLALRHLENPSTHPALEAAADRAAEKLRQRWGDLDRPGLREQPGLAAYDDFYRQFRKTYHVQLQLESVVFQHQLIRAPSALVTAMFLVELETGLLTAVHDRDRLIDPLLADVSRGGEKFTQLSGQDQELKAGDLYITDQQGIVSSVIYGPDRRTRIRPETTAAVFTTYGPPGITGGEIRQQLERIEAYVGIFSPQLKRELLLVLPE
jgi:DNA/RNA-binding domain of Phe-tRNA-synthetase-like protein